MTLGNACVCVCIGNTPEFTLLMTWISFSFRCGAGFWTTVSFLWIDTRLKKEMGLLTLRQSFWNTRTWLQNTPFRTLLASISTRISFLLGKYYNQGRCDDGAGSNQGRAKRANIYEPRSCICIYSGVTRNVIFQRVDLLELPLPYENDTFDYIFIRCMMDVVPDEDWDDVLNELVRIMKKGGYIECLETYPDLFDTGPAMSTIMQRKSTTTPTTSFTPIRTM